MKPQGSVGVKIPKIPTIWSATQMGLFGTSIGGKTTTAKWKGSSRIIHHWQFGYAVVNTSKFVHSIAYLPYFRILDMSSKLIL